MDTKSASKSGVEAEGSGAFIRQGSIRKVLHSSPDNEPMFGVSAKMLERSRPETASAHQSYGQFIQEYCIIAEFNLLSKHLIPGLYAIPSAKSPLLWFGVIFVKDGPYRGGVFRFNLLIPETFPSSTCPRVIFECEMGHPGIEENSKELDLRGGFSDWTKDTHHLWQALRYVHTALHHIDPTHPYPVNRSAARLYEENRVEFESKASTIARLSVEKLYEAGSCDDPHYLKFSKYQQSIHGEATNTLTTIQVAPSTSPQVKCLGLSWVKHGTLETFSKLVS